MSIRSPASPLPARPLLDQIAAGELDAHLPALARAVQARADLLHTISAAKALSALCVGDRVQINQRPRPRYLPGVEGVVVVLDDEAATVGVHPAVGRLQSGEIRCPPLALDRLEPAA
jgi:hypothetical protein